MSVVIQSSKIVEIRLPADQGIAGACFRSGETINVANAYDDPRFYRQVDEKSGYHTESLLAAPVAGKDGKPIGVIEAINKRSRQPFDKQDESQLHRYAVDIADVLAQAGQPKALLPGMLVVTAVAGLATLLHALLPAAFAKGVGVVLVAILLGLVVKNVFTLPIKWEPGIRFALHNLLRAAIVLLGAQIAFSDVVSIGGKAAIMVVVLMLAAFTTAHLFARLFKLPMRLATLISVGAAICGNSAIAATAPAIKAREEDLSFAIAVNTLLGTSAMFLYPIVGATLNFSDAVFGTWVGAAVNDTAQVVATAFSVSPRAGEVATVVKLTRNAFLGVVVVAAGLIYAKWARDQIGGKKVALRKRIAQSLPVFLLGFLAMAMANTFGLFGWISEVTGRNVHAGLKDLTTLLIVGALAGVGLGTKFKTLRATGLAPVAVGVGVSITTAVVSLLLIHLLGPAG
jgi:uncharacterized integral membrane protein (TIGR00698 family)